MSRLLVIGLDSADADLIERWASEGDLPTFARVRAEGAWGRLATSSELMHVSGWPSLYTGLDPARHGLYHAYQAREGLRGVERARPERIGADPFWVDLDRAGRRVIVMDAFMTAPLDAFSGIQILEYGTWTWFGAPETRPRALGREIARRFGSYPGPEHLEVLDVPDPIPFRDRLVEGVGRKTEVVEWLVREHEWDTLFVTFGETHGAGHYLWHHDDRRYPADRARTDRAPHPLRDVYMAIDAALARLLGRVATDVTVLIVSVDGMGPNHAAPGHVPEILDRLDLFHGAGVGGGPAGDEAGQSPGLLARARAMVPLPVRQAVSRCLPRRLHYQLSMRWVNDAVDWERTRAFCVPNSNEAYVRVRRAGRDPGGRETDASYADILDLVARAGVSLRGAGSGRPVARDVVRVDDVLAGPRRGDLPDLVITWDEDAGIERRLVADDIGVVEAPSGYETAPFYTGNHRPNAFALARGPAVVPGSSISGDVRDVAPTACALLGVEPPARYQGRVWTEVTG